MNSPIIDKKLYTVVSINGYRSPHLTLDRAQDLAARLREQMRVAGWAGKVRIFYHDGTEVETKA